MTENVNNRIDSLNSRLDRLEAMCQHTDKFSRAVCMKLSKICETLADRLIATEVEVSKLNECVIILALKLGENKSD